MTARILVVDDVPANARLLEAKLSAEYYQVAVAADGPAAIDRAEAWQPDLILLDVMMAGMDGYACCRVLKAEVRTRHIPVVMVTALSEPDERLMGLDSGADDFLTKPVDFATLFARIRSLVRTKRLLDELRARGETGRTLGIGVGEPGVAGIGGRRALIIDDWPAGAQQIRTALALDGITTVLATSGEEAAMRLADCRADLIVLSLSLLAEDPLALASRLRADDATRDTPMLLLAEPAERGRILRGFDLGANDWLLQPLDQRELRARARNQIRRRIYEETLRADLGEALSLAILDPLTGLHNKRFLMHHLHNMLRRPAGPSLAVIMIDIDHFKTVNDQHGHAVGDRALQAVAERLRASTRAFDSVARYGGEEFVLIMPGAGMIDATAAAERIRATIASPGFEIISGLTPLSITISAGIAIRTDDDTAEAILERADSALYQAKASGRDTVRLFSPRPVQPI